MKSLALIAAATVVLALAGCSQTAPPVSDKVQSYYDANKTLTAAPTVIPIPKLNVGPGLRSEFFGDSWTAGFAASPSTQGYAYLTGQQMGWENVVYGVSGTGYLNPGPNNEGTYLARMNALPVNPDIQILIIQGGINDASKNLADLGAAAASVFRAAHVKFPSAEIVVLGPAAPSVPPSPELSSVNSILSGVAQDQKLHYISPLQDVWISAENYSQVIDARNGHPSTVGHAYLADKTTAALRAMG